MPLSRYLIRNEFGLAEPELYKGDGSEALLQGVAVAGLVGVLRQLGDLAEFAAEIFHDLHEEVMATAARGHGLMARVQQLEADFPSTEKALLSQTSHSPFFSAPGTEWHPNLHPEQNLVTLGDLPRFVMGSYEECRGPPRLFLLDKFDVAGDGACLKRYTDPSFFKVEARSPELATDVQRDKKTRKVKKKGARMRNGETPKNAPPLHAKLHQLLQEERLENGFRDPARVVKLKKRQLNGYPFDLETGKSYMEKFVESPSPEHKLVCEVTFNPPCLSFTSDNRSETTIEVLEINTVNAVRKSLQGNELTCSPPYAPEEVIESSIDELREEIIYRASETPPELFSRGDTYKVPSNLPDVMYKNKYAVNGEGRKEGSLDGYPSDDVTSETGNYMDALTKIKSDMETDNEHRAKSDMEFYNHEIREQLELLVHLSDSHSIGNASASDNGNSSFKRERSTFSYSDTSSNLAGKTPSHGDGAGKGPFSNEACIPESYSDKLQVLNDLCTERVKILDTRETSCGLAESVETWASMTDSTVVCSSIPLQNRDHGLFSVPGETHVVDELHNGDLNVISDAPLHLSHVSEIRQEKQSSDYCVHEMLKVTAADKYCTENFDSGETDSAHSVSTTEEPLSVLQEVYLSSETNLENLGPMVDVLQPLSFPDQQSFSLPDVQQLDDDSAEACRSYFEEKTNFDDISKAVGGQETGGYICNVDGAVREAIPLELPCNHLNYEDDEDEVNNDMTMETVEAEDVAIGLTDSSHSIFSVNHPAMDQSDSGIPLFGIFPEATKGHQEMPPLPPMQWRMGKARNALLDSMRESVQCSQDSHTPVLSSAADEKVQFRFLAPDRGILQPENPFLPHVEVEDEELHHNFEHSDGNSMQLTPCSLQPPNMVDDLASGDTHSLSPFIALPTISRDEAKHAIQASGGELIQSSSNPFSPELAVDDANCSHDPVSSKESPPKQLAPVIAEDVKMLQHIPKDVERQGDNVKNEKPQTGLPTSGGEIAWHSKTSALVSLFEVPKPNGHSTMKLPRPRSPLIEAVAAPDKSKLRKVTDRVRPGIAPKVDERDTLLEQIRAKSFNLKPAVVTRPSIEGPKTNLKVVAIVEKANAIRQALAGSDDDDDEDSWSDS